MISSSTSQKCSLFVGDLSIFCTEKDLVNTFSSFGSIVDVKVMRCEETHKNLCYGFVKFSATNAAIKAMQEMNGKLLHGRPLRISWASHKVKKGVYPTSISDAHGNNSSSIHVNYSADQIDSIITEDHLRKIFSKYGEVLDITVKKFEVDEGNKVQRGYGFVHYPPNVSGILSALKCTEEMKDVVIDKIHFKCDVSHKLVKQLMNQQDPEVINLVKKYFPLGLQDYKDKEQVAGEARNDDSEQLPSPAHHNPSNAMLTVQTSFPGNDTMAAASSGYRDAATHGALPISPQLPFPIPPLYNGYPLYPVELGFDQRFTSSMGHQYFTVPVTEIGTETDLSSFSAVIGSFPPQPSLSETMQCKSDSESGESVVSSSYSARETRQPPPAVVVNSPWSSRPMESVYSAPVFSPTAWPIQNVIYPYFSIPFNASAINSFPYLLPSPNPLSPPAGSMFDYQFPANSFSVSPAAHTALFPHQTSPRKAK